MGLAGKIDASRVWQPVSGLPDRMYLDSSRSASTLLLRWQQAAPDHVQVRQREHREQPCRVLCQPAIAHLGKAPQLLHHPEGVLAAGAGCRAQAVDPAVIRTEWGMAIRPAVHTVTHPVLLGGNAMHLAPVRLVPVQLPLLP